MVHKGFKNNTGLVKKISVLIVIYLMHIVVELGCHYGTISRLLTQMSFKYVVLNLMLDSILLWILWFMIGKLWISEIIYCVILSTIAVINYYVIEWHATPLSIRELKNIKTALNVLNGYRFIIYRHVLYITILFVIALTVVLLYKHLEADRKNERYKERIKAFGATAVAVFGAVLFFQFDQAPNVDFSLKKPLAWNWLDGYRYFGYTATTVSRAIWQANPVVKPDGYDECDLQFLHYGIPDTNITPIKPDIILILNETFYDLNQVLDLQTDVPFLDKFYSLDHCTRGYAVVPEAGGGTNRSEYELLTANSMELIPDATPFNELEMNGANSIVSFLSMYGYKSTSIHPHNPNNYSRSYAYPAMGFTKSLFLDDLKDLEYYYDRKAYLATDQSLYSNLIMQFEAGHELEDPGLYYVLTMQNHGGYEMNDGKYDQVHAINDYGEYNDQINEYLTCIRLSDEAFFNLISYYSRVKSPVLICMVGDHCPSFLLNLEEYYSISDRVEIALRSTPFIIWSNYLEGEGDIGKISLNYLTPMLLSRAGFPLSIYYSYVEKLRKTVPILTSLDYYVAEDGTVYKYNDKNSPYNDEIQTYLNMEYNNILTEGRVQRLFEPIYEENELTQSR